MAKTVLRLEAVSKVYELEGITVKALDKVSLEIEEGEFLAVVGPSGCGKSTLLQLMGLLDRNSSGKITFLEKDVSTYTDQELARTRNTYLGFIFQQFNLLPKTSSLDNVMLPILYSQGNSLHQKRREAEEILVRLGMGERLRNHPRQLSGGQQQRVAIARALINNPRIIFADEPTGNLDSKSGQEVSEILRELNREGRTVVLVTHDSELAAIAKRQVHMRDGRIV